MLMEGLTRMKPIHTQIKEESPAFYLRGENLEYYRNIEYLKEVTRQANALLDRSNAKYENILDDQKLGYRVRARSNSNSTKSISPEMEGKCVKCGLCHGAADFCIVKQIMDNERQIEDDRRRSKTSAKGSWKSFTSNSMEIKSLKPHPDLTVDETSTQRDIHKHFSENINVLGEMTAGQVLETYEMLCARYGANAARKFLLANSLANQNGEKIEQWTTPSGDRPKITSELTIKPLTHYKDISALCLEVPPQSYEPLCPGVSQEVTEKMEQLVHLIPPCEGHLLDNQEKKWKAVFRKQPSKPEAVSPKKSERSEQIEFQNSVGDETCNCESQKCECGVEKICTIPKLEKKCSMDRHEVDNENNYVLTMRKQIWKRRETKREETLNALFTKESQARVVSSRRESKEYLKKARMEQYKTLKNCLTAHLREKNYDHNEFDSNVKKVADISSPGTAINNRQWDHWLEHMKEQQEIEEQDEIDSLPSEIPSDEESKSMLSHSTGVDYKPGRIKPSRIPYADDVYDLIDNLYDKISSKFETCILKNSFKISRLSYRPTYAFLYRKMTLLRHKSPFLHSIMNLAKFRSYPKRLTPFGMRKVRKMKRLEVLRRKQVRTDRRRARVHGLQLGKRYRRTSQGYGPESGYVGLKPHERKLLDPHEPDRFAKLNLVGNPLGKAITPGKIHHDFALIRSMFEDASEARREDLIDQGMLDRLYEFQKKMYNAKLPQPPLIETDTEDEGYSEFTYPIPPKDEDIQLLQKANSTRVLRHRHLQKPVSCENVPHREEIRNSKLPKAEKSNSADKLKNKGKLSHNTAQKRKVNKYGTPQKCTSSINVKGEKAKRKEKSQESKVDKIEINVTQNRQVRSSVKSLTNLLPPLKGHNAQNMTENEFEETISSLQHELSNLLMQQSCRPNRVAPIKTGKSDETKSIPKKKNSGLTKLPELKTATRKTSSKTSMCRISNESLPHIKQRESIENLKPGQSQEKLPKNGLARKTSMLNLQSGYSKPSTNGKLPQLVDGRKMLSNSSKKSLSRDRKKSGLKIPKIREPPIIKQSVNNKAWR